MREIKFPFEIGTAVGVFENKVNKVETVFAICGSPGDILANLTLLISALNKKGIPLFLIKACFDYVESHSKELNAMFNGGIEINVEEFERQAKNNDC